MFDQTGDHESTDATALLRLVNGNGTDLAEVLPENVQRAAADDCLALDGNPKFLHALVERDGLLFEQHATRVLVDERADTTNITRGRAADFDRSGHRRRVSGVTVCWRQTPLRAAAPGGRIVLRVR